MNPAATTMPPPPTFLLASILLEPNRWKPGRPPSVRISEWSARAAAAGFEGWELWENHHRLAGPAEQLRLARGELPVHLFNTYEPFSDFDHPGLRAALSTATALGATGMKFNVGPDRTSWPAERSCVQQLAPLPLRLLCECHPGTSLEQPEAVAAFTGSATDWPFDVILHPFLIGPEKILQAGPALGRHLRHVHVQMRHPGNDRHFLHLADDAPRARDCLAALAQIGFRGSFACEFAAPTGGPDDRPEILFAAAVRDLAFLRENWQPLA